MRNSIKVLMMAMSVASYVLFYSTSSFAVKRDLWQKPNEVFKAISTSKSKDQTFCEIGAGSGYFSLKAAQRFKHVYAAELSATAIKELSRNKLKHQLENMTIILAKEDDPLFPPKKCDIIFMGLVYHHISHRVEYLKNLKKYLTGNGRVVNLDNAFDVKKYKGTGKKLPSEECRLSKKIFINEAKKASFSKIKEHHVLPMQYLIELQ